jgi:hypothetical protein
MSNVLLTTNAITREAVRLWRNSNAFIQNLDRQYDDQYMRAGAKIGNALRIRLPNDFVTRTGAAAIFQSTNEQNTVLTLATQQGVDLQFTSVDLSMSMDDFSERVLAPAVNVLAGTVAASIMAGSEAGGVCNFVDNEPTAGTMASPTSSTYLLAGAILDNQSAPVLNRRIVNNPTTDARVTASLQGLFNPQPRVSEQYETGSMKNALGADWMRDQTVLMHTSGTQASGTVAGANQTGTTLNITALTGTLVAGDIITIANVNGVNRINKATYGQARQFVIVANANAGATSIQIYPAIVPPVGVNPVQYQTVTASPAAAAPWTQVGPGASATYRKNIMWVPNAIAMATADLIMPPNVDAARQVFDGVSMRIVRQYIIGTDVLGTRLDVLYGYLYVRPEWCCVIADIP